MKISSVNSRVVSLNAPCRVQKAQNSKSFSPKVLSLSEYKARNLAFTGAQRNKEQVIFIGAESDPYSKAGGVGTVMKDYRSFSSPENQVEIIPYYGANNSEATGVVPLKDEKGNFIMHTTRGDIELELVSSKFMQWGKENSSPIMLFKPKNDDKSLTYFVFTDQVSSMKKPYESTYVYSSGGKQANNGWKGDPYAKFSKAAVEFMDDIVKDKAKTSKDFNPATVVCSDSQTAYVIEYMAHKATNPSEKSKFEGINPTYIGHNLGPGYCGETSMQNMFVNLGATPEQISKIEHDPVYEDKIKGDNYFRPYVEKALDETGCPSAVQIPLYWADKGYVKSFSVVSEDYADSIANNPQAAHNIYNSAKELYKNGVFNGIMNPLNDPAVDPTKELMNQRYNEDCVDTDGKVYPKFDVYPENPTYEDIQKVKNSNKLKLLERLSAKDTTIITGNPKRTAKINPENPSSDVIKPELIKMIKEGKGSEVPVFVSWGRTDTQKGHDITLNAFEKFAKTEEGKNAILILGAGLDKGRESAIVSQKVESMLDDPDLKGRIVHIEGWAPAYALASAGDAAIFSSRFEPCGLTDLEAMKYYCSPIVTNTQGFKQKNFDPRNEKEAAKATSYKTKHEYNLLKDCVALILSAYVKDNYRSKLKVMKEFPTFYKTDENGKKVYDDSLFKDFAQKAHDTMAARKKELTENLKEGESLSKDWCDWDNLSKDFNFKFGGFARELKDGILISEMADAMKACVTADNTTKEKITDNLKNLKTGWKNNENLNPDNKSSYALYKERHLYSDGAEPDKGNLLSVDDATIDKNIEDGQKNDLLKRVSTYSASALAAIAGFVVSKVGSKRAIEEGEKKIKMLEDKCKFLESEINNIKKTNKRNLVIVGAVAAVAGAALTFLVTKFINKKKSESEELNNPTPEQNVDNKVETPNVQVNNTAPAAQTSVSAFGLDMKAFLDNTKISA